MSPSTAECERVLASGVFRRGLTKRKGIKDNTNERLDLFLCVLVSKITMKVRTNKLIRRAEMK